MGKKLTFHRSGTVFGWGKNLFGQLGVNDNVDRSYPTQLKTLRSLGVRYVAAGDDFSVFLTSDGKHLCLVPEIKDFVFTFLHCLSIRSSV